MFHVKHCVPALEGRFASTAGGRRRIIAVPAHAGDDREAADRLFPIASAMFHVKHSYGLPVRRMQGGALEGSRGGRGGPRKPQDARRRTAKTARSRRTRGGRLRSPGELRSAPLGAAGGGETRGDGSWEAAGRAAAGCRACGGGPWEGVGRAGVGRGRAWGARGRFRGLRAMRAEGSVFAHAGALTHIPHNSLPRRATACLVHILCLGAPFVQHLAELCRADCAPDSTARQPGGFKRLRMDEEA